MDLTELQEQYSTLSQTHKLPSFETVNSIFEIDRIERDTTCLLREVRKTMMDKIVGYIRLIEMMINPSQAPPTFLIFVKNVTESDRKQIETVYKNFVELELHSLKQEVSYSEKGEAALIKQIFSTWEQTQEHLLSVIGLMEKNWHSDGDKKSKGYFG